MSDSAFPIHPTDRRDLPLVPQSIPYWIVARPEPPAPRNHYQTVQRLKERQGCSWRELLAILTDRRYQDVPVMSNSSAMVEVVSIVGRADPVWKENWSTVCAERANKRSPKVAPFEVAK